MLHPRHHLLADVAALVEVDSMEPIHIGFVRKRVAIDKVEPAARNAQSDAVGIIGGAIHEIGADQIGDFLLKFRRHKGSPAQRRVAWIGEGEIWLYDGIAIPRCEHAETVGQIFH